MKTKETIMSIEQKHADMVMKLTKPGWDILNSLDGDKANLIHMALGVAGEAGELVDAIKRHAIYGKSLDVDNVIEELGDLEFYASNIRQSLGLSRELVLERNHAKLAKRYGEKYSNQAAIARADKDPGVCTKPSGCDQERLCAMADECQGDEDAAK